MALRKKKYSVELLPDGAVTGIYDITKEGLVAYRIDGTPVSPEEKGSLWEHIILDLYVNTIPLNHEISHTDPKSGLEIDIFSSSPDGKNLIFTECKTYQGNIEHASTLYRKALEIASNYARFNHQKPDSIEAVLVTASPDSLTQNARNWLDPDYSGNYISLPTGFTLRWMDPWDLRELYYGNDKTPGYRFQNQNTWDMETSSQAFRNGMRSGANIAERLDNDSFLHDIAQGTAIVADILFSNATGYIPEFFQGITSTPGLVHKSYLRGWAAQEYQLIMAVVKKRRKLEHEIHDLSGDKRYIQKVKPLGYKRSATVLEKRIEKKKRELAEIRSVPETMLANFNHTAHLRGIATYEDYLQRFIVEDGEKIKIRSFDDVFHN